MVRPSQLAQYHRLTSFPMGAAIPVELTAIPLNLTSKNTVTRRLNERSELAFT